MPTWIYQHYCDSSENRRPLLHCFGHIHAPGGQTSLVDFQGTGGSGGEAGDDARSGLVMARQGRTLFVNDALATNKIDANDRAYVLRKGGKPIVVGIPNRLL